MLFALLGAAQLNHPARQIYPRVYVSEREVVSRESAEERDSAMPTRKLSQEPTRIAATGGFGIGSTP